MATTYIDRITVCEHLQKWSKVVSDCTACLQVDPIDHRRHILRSRAAAYVGLRNYAKAKADLQEAVKLSPDDIKIHNDLVAVYKALGDKNGVAEEGEKIKSLNRDY